jgi:hypothetical protein
LGGGRELMSQSRERGLPDSDDCPDAVAKAYTMAVTGSDIHDEYLCVQYLVSPTPTVLVGDRGMHEGSNAGLAVDSRRRVYRECRSGYRVSPTGSNVAGALKIGPASWVNLGPVRVLFSPLAGTPALERNLCEVWLFIDETGVRATAVRWA